MPKSKKLNSSDEDKKTAWRTPVKLPVISTVEPMKSLYAPNSGAAQTEPQIKDVAIEVKSSASAGESAAQEASRSQEIGDLTSKSPTSSTDKPLPTASMKHKVFPELSLSGKQMEAEEKSEKLNEADFLRLLRTEKMDFYSLAEILRGSSMALYCVLYSESLAKGEMRCQMRQNELMMRAGINNPATLYKQERWLTTLHLINKSVRLGNHNGASYEVRSLETLPLPNHILNQFGGYLAELVR